MLLLFMIVFIDLVGFGIIIPLLPFYGEHFGASPAVVGLLMATYSVAQLVSAPLWGRLSDHHGRRPVLLWTLAGTAVGYLLLGFADSIWMLFLARAVGGLMAGNISTAFAYAADITTPENRAKGMGLVGAAFSLGFIFGPAIGGVMAGDDPANADFFAPSMAAVGMSLLAFAVAVARLKESLPPEVRARLRARPRVSRWTATRRAFGRPDLGRNLLLLFIATTVFAGMEMTFAMWSRRQLGWGPEQNGWLFACVGLLATAVQAGGAGRLSRKFGEERLVVTGSALLAAGLAVLPASHGIPVLTLSMVLMTVGFSLLQPALSSLISLSARAEDQGGVMGVSRSVATLARIVGPAYAGGMFAAFGRESPYLAGAVMTLAITAIAGRALLRRRRGLAAQPARDTGT